jgi:hypothetical protein
MGALKVAALPEAAPWATGSETYVSSRRKSGPRELPKAAPASAIGPLRPTEPCGPVVMARARMPKKPTPGRMRPPGRARDSKIEAHRGP